MLLYNSTKYKRFVFAIVLIIASMLFINHYSYAEENITTDEILAAIQETYPNDEYTVKYAEPSQLNAIKLATENDGLYDKEFSVDQTCYATMENLFNDDITVNKNGESYSIEVSKSLSDIIYNDENKVLSYKIKIIGSVNGVSAEKVFDINVNYEDANQEFVSIVAEAVNQRKFNKVSSLDDTLRLISMNRISSLVAFKGGLDLGLVCEMDNIFYIDEITNLGGTLIYWPLGEGDAYMESIQLILLKDDVYYFPDTTRFIDARTIGLNYINTDVSATEEQIVNQIITIGETYYPNDQWDVTAKKYIEGNVSNPEDASNLIETYLFYLEKGGYNEFQDNIYILEIENKTDSSENGWAFVVADNGEIHIDEYSYLIDSDVKLSQESYKFDGNAKKPEVSIEGLTKGIDFEVVYENNIEVGEAKVTITGKGLYKGTVTKVFIIEKAENSWISGLSMDNWLYGEIGSNPNSVAKYGTSTYKYYSDSICNIEIDKPSEIGTYYVKAFVTGSNDYSSLESAAVRFEIIENLEQKLVRINLINATDTTTEYVKGLDLNMPVNDLKKKLNALGEITYVSVTDSNGVIVNDGIVSTGMRFTIELNGVRYTKTIVIVGDADGDGKIYATDYLKIKFQIMGTSNKLSGPYALAADTNRDGKIYATDYMAIKNSIMGISELSQK